MTEKFSLKFEISFKFEIRDRLFKGPIFFFFSNLIKKQNRISHRFVKSTYLCIILVI